MKVEISLLDEFSRQFKRFAKKYKSIGNDYCMLKKGLLENPFLGESLGGGVLKIRMTIGSEGKDKSGGTRVLMLNVLVSGDSDVTLLTIYDKEEIDNVSDNYIKWLVSEAKI